MKTLFLKTLCSAAVLLLLLVRPAAAELFLWQATNGEQTFDLFGSLHMLPDTDFLQAPELNEALRKCRGAVFEFDLAEAEQPEATQLMARRALLKHAILPELLPADLWQQVTSTARELGLDSVGMEHYQPWFAAMQIASAGLVKIGFDPANGADMLLYRRAVSSGKPIIGLETMVEQLELFSGMEQEVQIALLRQTLEELTVIREELGRLYEAWQNRDLAGLEGVLLKSFRNQPDVYRRLLADRNSAWLETLTRLPAGRYLVVVGAGHLVGKQGLLEQLKRKGFRLTQ